MLDVITLAVVIRAIDDGIVAVQLFLTFLSTLHSGMPMIIREDISVLLFFILACGFLVSKPEDFMKLVLPQSEIPTLDNLLDFVSQQCKIIRELQDYCEKNRTECQYYGEEGQGWSTREVFVNSNFATERLKIRVQ